MMNQPSIPSLLVSVSMDTPVGRPSEKNQDAIGQLVPVELDVLEELGQIFVLAGGIGGLDGGDLASQYAVSTIIGRYYDQETGTPAERLMYAIAEANNMLYAEGQDQETPTVLATTVVAAIIRGNDLIVGLVGDSLAYVLRSSGQYKLLQNRAKTGELPDPSAPLSDEDQLAQKLARALGSMPSAKVDITTGRLRDSDHVVLCGADLARYMTPSEMIETVAVLPVEPTAQALVSLANERCGGGNISVIVLRVNETVPEDILTQLPAIPDPMDAWGQPKHSGRRPRTSRETRAKSKAAIRTEALLSSDLVNKVRHFLRGNMVITSVGLSALLALFVIAALILGNIGDDSGIAPTQTPTPAVEQTATAQAGATLSAQMAAIETNEAILANTAIAAANQTLTPATPFPTSGPQLTDSIWFKVLPGDPIATYQDASLDAAAATALEPGTNYRTRIVQHELENGPWYEVVDNLGREARWVNAPSMHQRIVVVDTAGNPLPAGQQPPDIPLPAAARRTTTPDVTKTPLPTTDGSDTPMPTVITPSVTAEPEIAYGVEIWEMGDVVTIKDDLDLCQTPKIDMCAAGPVTQAEIGTIIDGPVAADAHWWWQVEFEDGRSGWVAQVLLGVP